MRMNDADQPDVPDMLKKMYIGSEIEKQMMERREIFLWGAVDDDSARAVVQKLLYFDGQKTAEITSYINSAGGIISSGVAVYDDMKSIKSEVKKI